MLYIIEAPESDRTTILNILRKTDSQAREPVPIVQDHEGRTASVPKVAEFFESILRCDFPQLLPWEQLDNETRHGIATTLAGNTAWQFPSVFTLDQQEVYNEVALHHPQAVSGNKNQAPPAPQPMANPAYVLISTTTADVSQYYGTLCESTVDGETLAEWEDLPEEERANLALACQRALEINPAADLLDILNENIDWDTYGREEQA